uniref:Uncharacterized protein n=1 Tax=viral metagenome TaxID=1070528 RepID=A0A6C0KCU1_9ZZZZ
MRNINCCKSTRKNIRSTKKYKKHFSLQHKFSKNKTRKKQKGGERTPGNWIKYNEILPTDICIICNNSLMYPRSPGKTAYFMNCGCVAHTECLRDYCNENLADLRCKAVIDEDHEGPIECGLEINDSCIDVDEYLNAVNEEEHAFDDIPDILVNPNKYWRLAKDVGNAPFPGGSRKKRKKKTRKKRKKKQFLYNPNDPSKSFDVYIDKNPKDTIPIKYTTVKDVKDTIKKLERLYKTKKYPHKRIWQVGMIMKVRLEAMLKHKTKKYPNAKKVKQRFNLANKYFKFLGKRTKKKDFKSRKSMTFKF